MRLLGIEGGGTRTSALLVEGADTVLASFAVGSGNLQLLNGEELAALLASIRDQLPDRPDRIGVGLAGGRSAGDRERLRQAVAAMARPSP